MKGMRKAAVFRPISGLSFLLVLSTGCMSAYKKSVGADESGKTFSRIYFTDVNHAWQGSLEALKSLPLDVSNKEFGFIQTKWKDNTSERNFISSSGAARTYMKAQYRFKVSLAPGMYDGRSAVKTTVQKEQLIQRDALEGWAPIPTDETDENTLLYRIGRIISIRMKLERIESNRQKRALQEAEPSVSPVSSGILSNDPELD